MNAKTCKKLRRLARDASVGKPARMYRSVHVPVTHRARLAQRFLTAIQTTLDPTCTRAIYQKFKKELQHAHTRPSR